MKKSTYLLFFVLFLFHMPFLPADPDLNISFSRDAFTDEGLYTSQVRNYLISGNFHLDESDAAIKTPLFSGLMFAVFGVFGIHLEAARLCVLIISLLTCGLIFRKDFFLAGLMTAITLLQYTIFQYSHFSLSEMLAVSAIVSGWYSLSETHDIGKSHNKTFYACLLMIIAVYFKFQYLYLVVLPPVFFFMVLVYSLLVKNGEWKRNFSRLMYSVLFTVALPLMYYFSWYKPNKTLFDYVLNAQTVVLFGGGEWFRKMIDFNISHFFINDSTAPFTFLFLFCVALSPVVLYRFRNDKNRVYPVLAAFGWCLLELHKPALVYLPGRYLVSTFFAMGLFSSLIIKNICTFFHTHLIRTVALGLLICWPVFSNISAYVSAFRNRSYLLTEMNKFVAIHATDNCVIAGAWAPSVSWLSNAVSVPVWKGYFNDVNTMEKYHPCIVVSEIDEEDSGKAWESQGIDLNKIVKETSDFQIRGWHARIYVLNNAIMQK